MLGDRNVGVVIVETNDSTALSAADQGALRTTWQNEVFDGVLRGGVLESARRYWHDVSGNQMDRTRAQMAAEQALTQGIAVLQANGDTCLADGCTGANLPNKGVTAVSAATAASAAASAAWSDTNSFDVTTADGQATTAKYSITWQSDASFTPVGSSKVDCKAYTVFGRGVGLSSKSVVVLQTVAFVCPTT